MLSETDWECLLPKVSRLVCEDEVSGLAVNKRFIICQVSCDWPTHLISDWSSASSGSSPRSPSSPAPTSSWCGCWRATSTGVRYLQIFLIPLVFIYISKISAVRGHPRHRPRVLRQPRPDAANLEAGHLHRRRV